MLRGAPVVESRVMRVSAEALHQNKHFPFTRRTTPVSQLASQSLNVINKALPNQLVVALRLFHFFALRLISNTSQNGTFAPFNKTTKSPSFAVQGHNPYSPLSRTKQHLSMHAGRLALSSRS